jgi:hypothetical protein
MTDFPQEDEGVWNLLLVEPAIRDTADEIVHSFPFDDVVEDVFLATAFRDPERVADVQGFHTVWDACFTNFPFQSVSVDLRMDFPIIHYELDCIRAWT